MTATMPSSHQWWPVAETASDVTTTWRRNNQRQRLVPAATMPNDTTAAQATWIEGIAASVGALKDGMIAGNGEFERYGVQFGVLLGNADEGKPVQPDSVEAWARDPGNPVGGYYGLRKGYRGRFANDVTPILELMGRVDLEHGPRHNRVRIRPAA